VLPEGIGAPRYIAVPSKKSAARKDTKHEN
jgi:hypothetical protein